MIAVATALVTMILGLPTLLRRMEARAPGRRARRSFAEFVDSRAEAGTGAISGREVLVQIVQIPAVLALGFTVVGIEFTLVRRFDLTPLSLQIRIGWRKRVSVAAPRAFDR